MILKFIKWLEEKLQRRSKTPWASFDTAGVENGSVRYDMSWNPAFLENLRKAGFTGHNEQEIVENFFLASILIPKEDALTEVPEQIGALETPKLSQNNRIKH